ncbi:MAG: nucleotide sugar dehydrogenase [Elusimicrobia bacterium]|nr:nucleotide sugar dehydrogenase [Elusimicrobiota bacterium]
MIGFAGLSHLGVVSSIAAASKGFKVIAFDKNREFCESLSQGRLPILEPNLAETLAANQGGLNFTPHAADLGSCDVVYFSLDIPTDDVNGSDLAPLKALIDEVAPYLKEGASLVVLSQVPPGFTRGLQARLRERLPGRSLKLFYQVETLIFGRALERALEPERFMVGCVDPNAALPPEYFNFLKAFNCPILVMKYESAELAKISINAFLAASVSTTNMLAEICEKVNADWFEIAPALHLDKRIGPNAYLAPGLGIAGGNIERDLETLKSLASAHGADEGVAAAFINHSRYRRDWVLRVLSDQALSRHERPVVAVWGLAYKPNTKSIKNSPSLALLNSLEGVSVRFYDPQVVWQGSLSARPSANALEACRGAHALVIMTPWEEFAAIATSDVLSSLSGSLIIDPYGLWSGRDFTGTGVSYHTLGRPVLGGRL